MSVGIQVLSKHDPIQLKSEFSQNVKEGLATTPKKISSSFFYDAKGSSIFEEIMDMPEYYLSDCEYEIIENYKQDILEKVSDAPFRLVELGAGDGRKTRILLEHFLQEGAEFEYVPIDISHGATTKLVDDIKENFPELKVNAIVSDYDEGLSSLKELNSQNGNNRQNLVLFLGSSIGNFTLSSALNFCQNLSKNLKENDFLFMGFDLLKSPEIMMKAYKDSQGITSRFNLNILERINRELDGNFNIDLFEHHAIYDPIEKTMKSYILSKEKQNVRIGSLDKEYTFDAWEAIYTENSWKYSLEDIKALATKSDFSVLRFFQDSRNYYTNTMWKVI